MPTDRSSRLRSAAERIRGTVPEMPDDARTSADPETGEQWDRGQVLAHVAEILPYWWRVASGCSPGVPSCYEQPACL